MVAAVVAAASMSGGLLGLAGDGGQVLRPRAAADRGLLRAGGAGVPQSPGPAEDGGPRRLRRRCITTAGGRLTLAGRCPARVSVMKPVPRFISWVPHDHDDMPGQRGCSGGGRGARKPGAARPVVALLARGGALRFPGGKPPDPTALEPLDGLRPRSFVTVPGPRRPASSMMWSGASNLSQDTRQ